MIWSGPCRLRFIENLLAHPGSKDSHKNWIKFRGAGHLGTRVGDKWLCVVVKISEDDAFVVTAYLTNRPKRGELLWPPNL
jgi:hypothetical protein